MTSTCIIVFSRNRTLQLKSLLRSIQYWSDVEDSAIHVLYKTEPALSYEPLKEAFGCSFVEQTDFLNDLKRIIEEAAPRYVQFMVDDLIFRDAFSLRSVERFMDSHADVQCFSPRLGRNIHDGVVPSFAESDPSMLVWDTDPQLGRTWNYFWDMSSSLYRVDDVNRYLDRCSPTKVTFPNPLESHYYSVIPNFLARGWNAKAIGVRARFLFRNKSNRMSCWEQSRCFTQGVNLVANRGIAYTETYSVYDLHAKMLEGYIADFKGLRDVRNSRPNAGPQYFTLVKDEGLGR